MALEVGTLTETVTVASEAQLLQTDKADVHTELKSAEITAMPLNRFRNYQALLNLVPGTTPMAFGNAETDTPARSLATNVNGQANTNNSTRTDGATNMNIWLPNHNMYISPAETIDTVNVSTSSFDAEQGMAGGAAVTVITKSGTNQFRGSAFEFYNSDELNAKPYYFGAGARARRSCRSTRTTTAARSAGRSAQEQACSSSGRSRATSGRRACSRSSACRTRRSAPATSAKRSTPTARCRPSTTRSPAAPTASAAQPFANNQIPANMINPIALKVLQLFPLPNTAGHRRRRPDRTTTSAQEDAHGRSRQLRRQGQLEPHVGASDLGQVQLHERGRRRPDELPRTRIRTRPATAATRRSISSRPARRGRSARRC